MPTYKRPNVFQETLSPLEFANPTSEAPPDEVEAPAPRNKPPVPEARNMTPEKVVEEWHAEGRSQGFIDLNLLRMDYGRDKKGNPDRAVAITEEDLTPGMTSYIKHLAKATRPSEDATEWEITRDYTIPNQPKQDTPENEFWNTYMRAFGSMRIKIDKDGNLIATDIYDFNENRVVTMKDREMYRKNPDKLDAKLEKIVDKIMADKKIPWFERVKKAAYERIKFERYVNGAQEGDETGSRSRLNLGKI